MARWNWGVMALACIATSTPAVALEPKQCLALADMNAALRAEGQRTLILANRQALNNDATRTSGIRIDRYANAVTANADGSIGYQLEGDLPREQTSRRMCVAAKLTNIRLMDARRPGVQQASLLGGAFDDFVRDRERIGTRPMLIADTVHPTSAGNEAIGLPLIVFGNMAGDSASIATRMPDGSAQGVILMGEITYTQEALRRLGR